MANQSPVFRQLLAIGVGLIGGSACLDAKRVGIVKRVFGHSRKLETSHQALGLGIIDEVIADPSDSKLREIDAVLLSIPVKQYKSVLTKFLPVLSPTCIIFDVGSTKADVQGVIDELESTYPGLSARFVGSHPIAGGEKHGPSACVPGLFAGKTCVIAAGAKSKPEAVSKVERFWGFLGANLRHMDPLDHDEMFGAVSHLPHLLAFAYVNSVLSHSKGEKFMAEGGAGFRDFTRIAASSPEMWADIFQSNDVALLRMLDSFEASLLDIRRAIELGKRGELDKLLGQASNYRGNWQPSLGE